MPATEVLSAPFKPDTNPQQLLRVVEPLPTVGRVFSGFVHGRPNQMRAFLDWDSVEAHEAFNASDIFPPFVEDFKSKVAGPFTLWHVDFKPSLEALHNTQTAPVTEVLTFYFAGTPPADFMEKAFAFREVLAQQTGFVDVALGVAHEEVEFEGEKGHPLVVLVGWKSEQDWKTFAESEEYKEKNPGWSLEKGVLRGFEMEVVTLEPLK
ncbi:hypothetical protein M409DRAFT_30532 [Zasmidium cellare ATCC 36951]|uniref:ABM domain-containing protein n=1 Tax=Zasmidium cellare ATCC 36951 TaxID=1080233 RepID=A0A6A6BW26_ZASCE|nr:uncharacterized protein M409DRAFT_30532 [Zasmidium cellare ATCC 36951]KAF2158997.1 hypothetical protein M409DRAFT_30532 [Zasmidium cellare ATCC 36951]